MKARVLTGIMLVTLFATSTSWAGGTATPVVEEEKSTLGDKLSLYGYGEAHYNNIEHADDEFDFHRFVFGIGYDFTDRIRLRSEIELEHAGAEVELEYAYIDFDINSHVNARVGTFLLPIGYLNQNHEPTTFYSVERPEIYTFIIPTTWWEGGAGFYGEVVEGLTYQIYGHTSLNYQEGAADDELGFNGEEGIRPGRQKTVEALANDFAGSARLQYTGLKGLRVGTSGFVGQTSQGDPRVDKGLVSLWEADAKYAFEGIEIEGLYAVIFNPEAGSMTLAQRANGNIDATDVIGKRMQGYMLEGDYHIFHHIWPEAPVDVVAFGRYENYDTNSAVPTGFTKNPAYDRQTITTGLSFMPIEQVAIKVDYAKRFNGDDTANDQFNVGLGYQF